MASKRAVARRRARTKTSRAGTRASPRLSQRQTALDIARATFVSDYGYLASSGRGLRPAERDPQFVVLGTADVGQLYFCDVKATYSQEHMEEAFAARMLGIIRTNDQAPVFVHPSQEVLALEVLKPELADVLARTTDAESPDYEVAESKIASGTWHVGYAGVFSGTVFDLPEDARVYLAGILDGAREDGTVLEVRKTSWDFEGILRQGINLEKEGQANIYAVLLGLPRWECAFSCRNGVFRTRGTASRKRAVSDIRRAVRLRWGIEKVVGVGPETLWKCRSKKRDCDYLEQCNVTPIAKRES